MELTDRELAIRWWSTRTDEEKEKLTESVTIVRETLVDSEIEYVWRKQQTL